LYSRKRGDETDSRLFNKSYVFFLPILKTGHFSKLFHVFPKRWTGIFDWIIPFRQKVPLYTDWKHKERTAIEQKVFLASSKRVSCILLKNLHFCSDSHQCLLTIVLWSFKLHNLPKKKSFIYWEGLLNIPRLCLQPVKPGAHYP